MVVASSTADHLERALGSAGKSFAITSRAGCVEVLDEPGPGLDSSGDLEGCARVPACHLKDLGDASFRLDHGLRYSLMSGAMANGIGSVAIVEAMGRKGLLGIFGAAGLPIRAVEQAIDKIQHGTGDPIPYGINLIHSPGEPAMEAAVVDLLLRRRVRLVEASAFLNLTMPVVHYRVAGLVRDEAGRIVAANRIIAKVSRVEVASKFMAPPPAGILRELVASGAVTPEQAEWAARIPMADDITAEADSGGHTDNQPAIVMVPTMLKLRDTMVERYSYDRPIRVGAAGGISTPWAAAAALAMGAAYLVTGSVNQSCVEAATSDAVRGMLAQAQQSDIAMAPAADMFEMGVKVQVLKRGTLFAMRAAKLYELYRAYEGIDQIPTTERANIEKTHLSARPWKPSGNKPKSISKSATRRALTARTAIPSKRWRWYFAGIWVCRHTGLTVASHRERSTTRSGADRPWRLSTTGFAGRFSRPPKTVAWRPLRSIFFMARRC